MAGRGRAWWLAGLAGLLALAVLRAWDPATAGVQVCVFRAVFDLPCPGCGLTRAVISAGHGSFELTAIVISAMGGMKLALALLKPGRYSRRHALKVRGEEGVRLLFGAAFMTLVAAFIEGFWSANDVASVIKFRVGAALWALVALWLLLGGRGLVARGRGGRQR